MQLSIGTTVSSWTVKGFGSWGKNNTVKYTLMEHKCGNTRKFQQWEIDNNKFKKCKKCEARVEYRKNAEHIIYKTMYRQYKHSAKQRRYTFELDYDDFIVFVNGKCHYCGREPFTKREITKVKRSVWHNDENILINGTDRINSNLGSFKDNCVPCCKICNFAKSDMSLNEWKKMIPLWLDRLDKI